MQELLAHTSTAAPILRAVWGDRHSPHLVRSPDRPHSRSSLASDRGLPAKPAIHIFKRNYIVDSTAQKVQSSPNERANGQSAGVYRALSR